MRLIVLALASLLTPAAPVAAQESPPSALSATEIAARSVPAVFIVLVSDAEGQPLSTGSAFLVEPEVLATNFHVLEGGATAAVARQNSSELMSVTEIVAHDAEIDVAFLRVPGLTRPILPNSSASVAVVGEPVYAIGNPRGLSGTFSSGIISGIRNFDGFQLFQITAPISPGSSGGPVLNQFGEIMGIAVAAYRNSQNLNFAIPIQSALQVLTVDAESMLISDISSASTSTGALVLPDDHLTSALRIHSASWSYCSGGGYFRFSVTNDSDVIISSPTILVSLRNAVGEPLDYDIIESQRLIPPGLAARLSGRVSGDVQDLLGGRTCGRLAIGSANFDARVLNFEIE